MKFSIYLNRRVFVMNCKILKNPPYNIDLCKSLFSLYFIGVHGEHITLEGIRSVANFITAYFASQ